jgi:hypothetical protein
MARQGKSVTEALRHTVDVGIAMIGCLVAILILYPASVVVAGIQGAVGRSSRQ